jgi:YVTN family beta-propeller protein
MPAVIATIPVGPGPESVAVSPGGAHVYVVNSGTGRPPLAGLPGTPNDPANASVSVIDTATNTVTTAIPVGQFLGFITISADGRAYVSVNGNNTVLVIDTATNTITDTIAFSTPPQNLSISPDDTRVYIIEGTNSVRVLDTSTNTVIATINLSESPQYIAFSPDGARAYCTEPNTNAVAVIDTATNAVTDTITLGAAGSEGLGPVGVAVSPDGANIYVTVTSYTSSTVLVIDTATYIVTDTIAVGIYTVGVAVSPDGAHLYAANAYGNGPPYNGTVSVIDTATNTVSDTIRVGRLPAAVAFNPDGSRVYVANGFDNTVSVISVTAEPGDSWHPPDLTGEVLGALDRDGSGWLLIGDHFVPIPPDSPLKSIIVEAATLYIESAIENASLGQDIRNRLQGVNAVEDPGG